MFYPELFFRLLVNFNVFVLLLYQGEVAAAFSGECMSLSLLPCLALYREYELRPVERLYVSMSGLDVPRYPVSMTPFCLEWFFGSEFNKAVNDSDSFSNRIEKFCSLYYDDLFVTYKWKVSDGSNIKLMGMDFRFDEKEFVYKLVDREYDALTLLCIGKSILKYLHSINDKGFVSADALEKVFTLDIMSQLSHFKYAPIILGNSEVTYTMWYNLIFLNVYYLIEKFLFAYKDDCIKNDFLLNLYSAAGVDEVIADLVELKVLFKSRLDQYLKMQIQVRGFTIIENSYVGFDSEYCLKNEKRFLNEIVSVQTAVQRRFLLQVPMYHPYDISYVHPLSSAVSDTYKSKVGSDTSYKYKFSGVNFGCEFDYERSLGEIKGMFKNGELEIEFNNDEKKKKKKLSELLLINNSLKVGISSVRDLMFKDVFDLNRLLIAKMKSLKGCVVGFDYFEDLKHDQVVFSFPLSEV
jgi:hypothetical protein